ncbi:2-amino-4-hydroxy-6-hydroxymethyldihydropteridine diphosphokinase [bacterium]|nr:2-amino-4-hydroxy-6-hydroxymethyldihydropteridine diphosphokinase [bacterium]
MTATTAYLGLGGNIGNVRSAFLGVLDALEESEACLSYRTSSLYITEPWGIKDQPEFYNMVVELEWNEPPQSLLRFVENIENEWGRDRTQEQRYGPRTLDIDILLFGDLLIVTPELTIPHLRLQERAFMLKPLAQLADDIIPPGWQQTVDQALQFLSVESKVKAVEDDLSGLTYYSRKA